MPTILFAESGRPNTESDSLSIQSTYRADYSRSNSDAVNYLIVYPFEAFVEYYNFQRYHESLNNVTPADVYTGRDATILEERKRIKNRTMNLRKQEYQKSIAKEQTVA